ncbi:hypothetical protein, partial [Salmonella sp. s54836]|uniref:hypothetical protein n=1 Tax=Salmonella sp. s54836 TaxID=3159673 RepID=UPI00397E9DB5
EMKPTHNASNDKPKKDKPEQDGSRMDQGDEFESDGGRFKSSREPQSQTNAAEVGCQIPIKTIKEPELEHN